MQLLLEEHVQRRLCNGFINLGFGAAGGDTAQRLAVYLDWQPPLIGKEIRKGQNLKVAFLHGVGAVLRGTSIERSVSRFLLCEVDGVERCRICFLEKKQVAAFVHNADSHFNILLFGFRLSPRDHGLDRHQVQIFLGRKIGRKGGRDKEREHDRKWFRHRQECYQLRSGFSRRNVQLVEPSPS